MVKYFLLLSIFISSLAFSESHYISKVPYELSEKELNSLENTVISQSKNLSPNHDDIVLNTIRNPTEKEIFSVLDSSSDLGLPIPFKDESFLSLDFENLSWMFKSKNDLLIHLSTYILDKNKKILSKDQLIIYCPIMEHTYTKYESPKFIRMLPSGKKVIKQGQVFSDLFQSGLPLMPQLNQNHPLALIQSYSNLICSHISLIETMRDTSKIKENYLKEEINSIWEKTKNENQ